MGEKLGQNFLVNKEIVKKIIEAADLRPTDLVLEIGPGRGALSFEIAKKVKKYIMVEKDRKLAEDIARNFQFPISNFQTISNNQNYKIENSKGVVSGDVLEINLSELIAENDFQNYKIIANLPYYITSPIIRKFLEAEFPPKEMILMVQKEVAERITAKPGKMSILAVAVQYYAEPEILFNVPRGNFEPIPNVDSSVIRITPHSPALISSPLPGRERRTRNELFFRVVRAGFAAKRKTLVNNLSNSFHLDKKEAAEKIISAGLKPTIRAQELSVADWKKLAELFL